MIPGMGAAGCFPRNWIWFCKSGIPTAHRRTRQTLRSTATHPAASAQAKICKAQQPRLLIPLEANAPKLQWCSQISDKVVALFIAVSRRVGSRCTVKP